MKKRPLITVHLIVISVLFFLLATSCKKDEADNPETVTDIDGNVYNTVTIDSQVWMKENLKVTMLNDGTLLTLVINDNDWGSNTVPSYSWSGNDANTKNIYGILYNCYCVMTNKLCPTGWHVPTDAEWTALTDFLGGEAVAGGKMKEKGTSHWLSPNTDATNESGFTGLPAGYRHKWQPADQVGEDAYFWSSTLREVSGENWLRSLGSTGSDCSRFDNQYENGLSIRCIKN
jgi:uncharacterized protein (TIGR02145 family)